MKLEITKPEIHNKKWGHELWLTNNEHFCGKILHFNKGAKFSMHFHDLKILEVWYVKSGKLNLKYIDCNNAVVSEQIINQGDVINIPRLLPHQLESLEESDIFEISNQHFESDSYRVFPGNSQLVVHE